MRSGRGLWWLPRATGVQFYGAVQKIMVEGKEFWRLEHDVGP